MKQSKLFPKTSKTVSREEISTNAQFLVKGGFINKLMAGVYTYMPLGLRVLKKIENVIREEINAIDGQEIFMPALHPHENYVTTGRENIDVLFHPESVSGKKYVLGQSHEEVIVPLVKQYISSYKDLPLYLYQIQTEFRNELRAKSGILRGREFMMKDLYSFHRDDKDFDEYYEKAKLAYMSIFRRVGIGNSTYLTFASGGTFSKYSHVFQTITHSGEDTIYLCRKCRIAVNKDIVNEQKSCPECQSTDLEPEKSIEVGNIFPLKTKFSNAFHLSYTDENGNSREVVMGCYGIGLGRVLGTVVEVNNDDNGIIWPDEIAPFDVHLISIDADKNGNDIYSTLQKNGVDVLYDDRKESAGSKLKDADLIGIPIRLVVSKKTGDKVEMKKRKDSKATICSLNEVLDTISKQNV
ncbi:prolyl-tRNA synthetase [Patescibacteria group bacterium]|nr:prolyl-tRNA synthetase [Patescibacteria group bacterium]MBU1952418.1 prolyl-tRNA synthetase [Patescibacteria group bacterium]